MLHEEYFHIQAQYSSFGVRNYTPQIQLLHDALGLIDIEKLVLKQLNRTYD